MDVIIDCGKHVPPYDRWASIDGHPRLLGRETGWYGREESAGAQPLLAHSEAAKPATNQGRIRELRPYHAPSKTW